MIFWRRFHAKMGLGVSTTHRDAPGPLARPGVLCPTPSSSVPSTKLRGSLLFKKNRQKVSAHLENFHFCTKNNTTVVLLKTASVQVSSIQIMQVRIQNKGKSVWKSRYDGDVSTLPSLNICLSSSNPVDKLKVIKKNFYKLCLHLLL